MIIIQPIGIIVTLFLLYYTYLHYKKSTLSLKEYVLWSLLWLGVIAVTLFPSIVNNFLADLGISRALDLFVIVAIFFLLIIVFQNYTLVHKLERRIEKFVREESLRNLKEERQK